MTAEAIAEAVQRPTMKFVATKTAAQLDLQALHRVRERLVSQRTGIIRPDFAPSCWNAGSRCARVSASCARKLPTILATRTDSPVADACCVSSRSWQRDWRCLDQRIDGLSSEIEALARQDQACSRLMTVPGIGPIISSAMVGRDRHWRRMQRRPKAATSALGSDWCPRQIWRRRTLGKISRRGNALRVRVLFVQAAWVVLVRIKGTGRNVSGHANPGSTAAKRRLRRTNVLAIRADANKLCPHRLGGAGKRTRASS